MTDPDDVPSLTLHVLRSIREELRATRTDLGGLLDQTNQRLDQTNQRLDHLERTTALGFERLTERIDNLRDLAGDRYRDHEARIRRLELHLGVPDTR